MDVIEVTNQSLSSFLCDHQVCQSCHVVDRDEGRFRVGHECPQCGIPGDGGHMYFHMNIHTLVNLIQEAYHSAPNDNLSDPYSAGKDSHSISIAIFFCTLREALLENFIYKLCLALEVPKGIFERLIADNKFHTQKQNKLFPSLTGSKWKDAINEINARHEIDHVGLDQFVVSVVEARNKFVHEGSKYGITHEMAKKCLKSIWGLINLYVGLHNTYIHPIYMKKAASNK